MKNNLEDRFQILHNEVDYAHLDQVTLTQLDMLHQKAPAAPWGSIHGRDSCVKGGLFELQ